MEREYLKKVLYFIIISVLAVGIIIYIGYHMVSKFAAGVEVQPAYRDTFTESVTFDAYIIRREETVRPNTSGTVNYLVANGEKVSAGECVADIYRTAETGLRAKIDAIDEKIERLKYAQESAAYTSVTDTAKIDSRIRETLYSIRRETAAGNMQSVANLSGTLLTEMNRRQLATGEVENFAAELAALEAERSGLISRMSDVSETIVSQTSAYYFYDVDGYEEAFSVTDIDGLTGEDMKRMMSARPAANGNTDGVEGCAGKFVYDYKWYAAAPVDTASLSYFSEGEQYNVTFEAKSLTLPMKLRSVISEEGAASAYLIFECEIMPSGFEYTRMQPISVEITTYDGYRVPESAVRVVKYGDTEVRGVYILYGGTVYFRRIEIILTQDGYVLCDAQAGRTGADTGEDGAAVMFPGVDTSAETQPAEEYESIPYLALYDMVITSSKELYDGKIIS